MFIKTLSAFIEGSDLPLSSLVDLCIEKLSPILKLDDINFESIKFEESFIKANAERKSFGISHVCYDAYQDTNSDALYGWEVINAALIDGPKAKDINLIRTGRVLISEKVKGLEKIIHLINKASNTSHVNKFNTAKEKLEKIDRKIVVHTQKEVQRIQSIKEKEIIENQKLTLRIKQEEERMERENKRKLDIELKRMEQEEKERKKQEAIRLKQEQDEAKRKKAEERKREKDELASKKKEEEERRK